MIVRIGNCDCCKPPAYQVAIVEVPTPGGNLSDYACVCLTCLLDAARAVAEMRGDTLRIEHTKKAAAV